MYLSGSQLGCKSTSQIVPNHAALHRQDKGYSGSLARFFETESKRARAHSCTRWNIHQFSIRRKLETFRLPLVCYTTDFRVGECLREPFSGSLGRSSWPPPAKLGPSSVELSNECENLSPHHPPVRPPMPLPYA